MLKKFLVLSVLLLLPVMAMAHAGRTDSKGGHYCYTDCATYGLKTGEYHYHDAEGKTIYTWDNNSKLYSRSMADRLRGRILLQVQEHGEAWYINMDNSQRYYM
ncbi:MAG TPA: YHYH domain-containing protein, partial [bacterium]|nr:YHYH domain-containing protein [bacterium]